MFALLIFLNMFAFIIPLIKGNARTYHHTDMCYPRQRIYNCSFQVENLFCIYAFFKYFNNL